MSEEARAPVEPLLIWSVPGLDGEGAVGLSAFAGNAIVVVGANGSGKSALSHWLSTNRSDGSIPVTRVLAHRRLWLQSSGTEMATSQHQQMQVNFANWDSSPASRVEVIGDAERASKLLYDLLGRVNGRNARIAELVDAEKDPSGIGESMLTTIGRVFASANLDLTFRITDVGTFDAVAESGAYPISEMSDGEKSAFLLAAETLFSPQGSVQILDEPERQLHRAISSDFVAALIKERADCAFVLLTHDLDLIGRLDPSTTEICTVRGVSWRGGSANGWSLEIEPAQSQVPDAVRQAILGGRNQLLFVEGEASSLDFPLYRLLFPDWTVVPSGGADGVKRATSGLAGASGYHWVDGRGVLDADARSPEEIAALAARRSLCSPLTRSKVSTTCRGLLTPSHRSKQPHWARTQKT